MKFIAIIPARYASTRFPGKPLVKLGGKSVVQRVYERVAKVFDAVVVATDNDEIERHVRSFGGQVVMTSQAHQSGTDRCFEAYQKWGEAADVVVNVQGDEPFIALSQLYQLQSCFENPKTDIATLVKAFPPTATWEELSCPNTPKVVFNKQQQALYFSRSVIPYCRGIASEKWASQHIFYKHIGLYAYRVAVLEKIVALGQSRYEKAESLEQLRWLEEGYQIQVGITEEETIGIDTPEDLERAERWLLTTS